MTLESRLVTYDWENQFRSFQEATHKGSFKPLCWMKKPTLLPVSSVIGSDPNEIPRRETLQVMYSQFCS
jgi:hypothetical protein